MRMITKSKNQKSKSKNISRCDQSNATASVRGLAVVIGLMVLAGAAPAEPGSTTAGFLLVPVGGRAVAMGGAYTGLAEDAYALYYNPAGLARSAHEVTFTHNEYILDLSQEYLAYARPLDVGTLGISVNYFDFGNFDRTTHAAGFTGIAAPTAYLSQGRFGANNLAVSVGYARRLGVEGFNVGAALKYIQQDIDNFSGKSVAGDFGLYWRKGDNPLSVGLSVLNVGDKLQTGRRTDDLPLTVRLGAAYRVIPDRLTIAADAEKVVGDDQIYGHAGIEYWIAPMLALRAGYSSVSDAGTGFTAGLGLRVNQLQLDYAFADENELDNAHRISMTYRF